MLELLQAFYIEMIFLSGVLLETFLLAFYAKKALHIGVLLTAFYVEKTFRRPSIKGYLMLQIFQVSGEKIEVLLGGTCKCLF